MDKTNRAVHRRGPPGGNKMTNECLHRHTEVITRSWHDHQDALLYEEGHCRICGASIQRWLQGPGVRG